MFEVSSDAVAIFVEIFNLQHLLYANIIITIKKETPNCHQFLLLLENKSIIDSKSRIITRLNSTIYTTKKSRF